MTKSGADLAREQAARLFALAIEARDKGNNELAEMLTAAASRCLDRVVDAEVGPPPLSSPDQQQPVAQQQQQIQPGKAEDDC